jgi:hypothetical protein
MHWLTGQIDTWSVKITPQLKKKAAIFFTPWLYWLFLPCNQLYCLNGKPLAPALALVPMRVKNVRDEKMGQDKMQA